VYGVAAGFSDGNVSIWDADSSVRTFRHHQCQITGLVFSTNGQYITSVADDCTLCLWDSTSGNLVWGPVGLSDDQRVYLDGTQCSRSTPLTQDGRWVAFVGKHNTILVFEVVYRGDSEIALHGPLVLASHTSYVTKMAFSPDGQFLATTSNDRTIRVWDLQAAAEGKRVVIDSASNGLEIANFDEALIDNDGWAICMSSRGGSPLRLMWIPEMHRQTLHRPSNVCAVGPQKQTRLDLKNHVHGKDWVECIAYHSHTSSNTDFVSKS